MAKSFEKEPLLFVDTTYKGCFVNEQSFFKTPTPKPKDIVADNYVHNFDQMSESNFKSLIPSNVTIREVVEERPSIVPTSPLVDESEAIASYEEESCPYETVNILVDYGDHPQTSFFNEKEISASDEQDTLVEEGVLAEEKMSDLSEENTLAEEGSYPITEESVIHEAEDSEVMINDVNDSNQDVVDVMNGEGTEQNGYELQLDENQQEILMFIQDLTNRPSMMKAPIVQIVKKDGSLKSGMIEIVDDWHITIDNLMDDVETISLADIEGIRILHL